MEQSKKSVIIERLIKEYMQKEESQMTDVEKDIRQELEYRVDVSGERIYERTDFFRKRIENIEKIFLEPETVIGDKDTDKVPKPVFNICDYSVEEQTGFYKVYIENEYKRDDKTDKINRKAKSTYNAKINVDQDYEFIMRVLKGLEPDIEYPNLNESEDSFVTKLYHEYRGEIVSKSKKLAKGYHEDEIKDDEVDFKDENIRTLWSSRDDIHDYSSLYVFKLSDLWIGLRENFFDKSTDCVMGRVQQKYYVRWNLWIFVIVQNFQYLFKHGFIKESDISDITNGMKKMRADIQEWIKTEYRHGIADAYFDYNYLLKARTFLLEELLYGMVNLNEHIPIKEDDLFIDEEIIDAEKCKYSKKELLEKFNSGVSEMCTTETFGKRLKFCKEFITKYNELSGRNLNVNSNKVLRAVYRALFVNSKCKNKRKNLHTMAKGLLNGDKEMLSKHYLLGMSISRELQMEEKNGEIFVIAKMNFLKDFYKLDLDIINKFLPSVSASSEHLVGLFDDLDKVMIEVLMVIYRKIKQPV